MRWLWEVDGDQVEAKRGFKGVKVALNGHPIHSSWRMPKEVIVDFKDGRRGHLKFRVEHFTVVRADLTIEGRRMIATDELTVKSCNKCHADVEPNARFCDTCGEPMPTAEDYDRRRNVKAASTTIRWVAILFALSGLLLFFVQRSAVADTMSELATLPDDHILPTLIDGKSYSVAELREQLAFETWGVLWINFFLAATMLGLAVWAKRAPLPALIAATATYAVVIVAGAIMSPASLAQGMIMKVVIIIFLVKGIRSALELRAAHAAH